MVRWRRQSRMYSPILLVIILCLWGPRALANKEVLDRYLGQWDVVVKTLKPSPSEMRYQETYRWILNGQFIEGKSTHASGGGEDLVVGTYDKQSKGYPFWVFSSSGTYLYLAPASWDPASQTMEWRSPPNSDIFYHTRVTFTGDNSRRWTVLVKDWKGTVLLQQRGRAERRRP